MAHLSRLPLRIPLRTSSATDNRLITGTVTAYREAVIRLTVHGSQTEEEIEAVVDTGFNGFLTLAPPLIATLDLPSRGRGRAILAD